MNENATGYGAGNPLHIDPTTSVNYMRPSAYLSNAKSLADQNTMTSQALAREQMEYQTQANAKAMDFNATEAQKTRDWQQLMSDTSHQREVKDLIAAGLNPILSANQGASTGTASSAQGVTSSGAKGNVDMSTVEALTNIYSTLKNAELREKELGVQNKQIDAQLAMNTLSNETNRYMAETSAAAGMYSAGLSSSAMRYSSELSSAASRFATMTNEELVKGGYYNQFAQLFDWMLGLAGDNPTTNAKEINITKPGKRYDYQQPGAEQLLSTIINAFAGKGLSKRLADQ